MKAKPVISDLKVKSFITNLSASNLAILNHVGGAGTVTACGSVNCPDPSKSVTHGNGCV